MKRLLGIAAAMLLGADQLPAKAEVTTTEPLAAKFGALESITQISLSPDGAKAAYIGRMGEEQVIYIADLVAGGLPRAIVKSAGDKGRLQWCAWASTTRLICGIYAVQDYGGTLLGFTRMIALDADGNRMVRLSKDASTDALGIIQYGGSVLDWNVPNQPGKVLMSQVFVPEVGASNQSRRQLDGLGVDLVDTVTLSRTRVEAPRASAGQYFSDGLGNIRVMGTINGGGATGYAGTQVSYSYRRPGSREWEPLSKIDLRDEQTAGFDPVEVDGSRNVVYGFASDNGTKALYSIALDGTGRQTKLLGRSDVDIDQIITIGRNHRVVGASYATERRMVEYFEPELTSLSRALTKALPGNPAVDIVDITDDGNKLLLLASSDTNPGMFYIFDKSKRQLQELLPVRTELLGVQLSPMKAVTYKAADGTDIPAYLTLPAGSSGKNLPAIVMPHGGPSSRDEWGFDWLVQYFASRGYAVLQPNFRGSSGYGSAWYQKNGFKSWRTAVGDVNDGGRWLVAQGIAARDKLGVVGWSYGGYAALQSAVLDPDLFKAIVAIAPVTDLERLRQDSKEFVNFPIVNAFIGQGPHVHEGSPAQNVARFKAPVLLFHGTMDQNVDVGESRLMEGKLRAAGKEVTYVEFPGLSHQLRSSEARTRLLSESDAFLRKAFGM